MINKVDRPVEPPGRQGEFTLPWKSVKMRDEAAAYTQNELDTDVKDFCSTIIKVKTKKRESINFITQPIYPCFDSQLQEIRGQYGLDPGIFSPSR